MRVVSGLCRKLEVRDPYPLMLFGAVLPVQCAMDLQLLLDDLM